MSRNQYLLQLQRQLYGKYCLKDRKPTKVKIKVVLLLVFVPTKAIDPGLSYHLPTGGDRNIYLPQRHFRVSECNDPDRYSNTVLRFLIRAVIHLRLKKENWKVDIFIKYTGMKTLIKYDLLHNLILFFYL